MSKIILYTFKNYQEIKQLKKDGFLQGNEFLIKEYWSDMFTEPYKIIQKKMNIDTYPIWLWIDKPDFRNYIFKSQGDYRQKNQYLLTIEVEKSSVLYSNILLWDLVLHNLYVPKSKKDEENWEQYVLKKYKKDIFNFEEFDNEDQTKITNSFQNIFTKLSSRKYETQACISKIEYHQVRSILKISKKKL